MSCSFDIRYLNILLLPAEQKDTPTQGSTLSRGRASLIAFSRNRLDARRGLRFLARGLPPWGTDLHANSRRTAEAQAASFRSRVATSMCGVNRRSSFQ